MPSRHEEKYIITYRQYLMLKDRAMQVLNPDPNGQDGSYLINSLYFDDRLDHALDEKLDGLPDHSKFRIRAYDLSPEFIKLEKKDKHGILTQKQDARINWEQAAMLSNGQFDLADFEGEAYELAAQMQSAGLIPTVVVRYRRDAFYFEGTDARLTFDTELEAISPDPLALFSKKITGLPVLDRNSVIMEIKYGDYIPTFLRKLTAVSCTQLSVSKYALCREKFMI